MLHLGKVVFVDLGALLVFGIQLAALGLVVLNRLAIQHLAGRRALRIVSYSDSALNRSCSALASADEKS